jgi:hypothetical protein
MKIFWAVLPAVVLATHASANSQPNRMDVAIVAKSTNTVANDCLFYYDADLPNGRTMRSKPAGITVTSTSIEIRASFGPERLPDPELASASNPPSRQQIGNLLVQVQRANQSVFRIERAGDRYRTYMREAPVLKIGRRWFVGDKVQIDQSDGLIAIDASVDLYTDFTREHSIEVWWKGAKRITMRIAAARLSPEQFSAQCMNLSPGMPKISGHHFMQAITPSTEPRLMDILGGPSQFPANLFDLSDRGDGFATFRITVGRDGLIKQCDVLAQSGKLPERRYACEKMRIWSRFYPATDRSGMPKEADIDFSVRWGKVQ